MRKSDIKCAARLAIDCVVGDVCALRQLPLPPINGVTHYV